MKISYRNLSVKDNKLKSELLDAVDRVLTHGKLLLGPEHEEFEILMKRKFNRKYAVAVSSGSEALYSSFRALGIGPGDEVITTALSWIATANAISMTGATPVFIDIKQDYLIDADLIEEAITKKTKAIVPVHFTGQLCDMKKIQEIANRYNLFIIEDGAQAFGAYQNDKLCGSFGDVSCFSLNPMKIFNAYGESGLILTNDEKLHEKLNVLRYAGTVNKNDCVIPSLNGRMDTIQAAMLLISYKYLPEKIENRRNIAKIYSKSLKDFIRCPEENKGNHHVYYTYSIISEKRDELMEFLSIKGIETQIQHPTPMPLQSYYKPLQNKRFSVATDITNKILCLPNQEDLSDSEVEYVCEKIKEFYSCH